MLKIPGLISLKFNLNGSGHAIEVIGSATNDTSHVSQNAFKDSNTLFVSNPSMFLAGDWVRIVRNDSSLIAFIIGTKTKNASGFKIIGAHTDSPNLKLKPNPAYEKSGYIQLGVEVYGGVLLTTWTDRDLSLAGRVIIKGKKEPQSKLVRFDEPLLRIPQLAIHLNRDVNEKGLTLNKQNHLPPIFSMMLRTNQRRNVLLLNLKQL